ncbi:ester cyclase [Larkinella soli]|uniref:ester cyclase n=1 Tax=Larkinella soli TaxID=1770527 RepID=UPI001E561935|nr:ester cyclase [Larkinella soli]
MVTATACNDENETVTPKSSDRTAANAALGRAFFEEGLNADSPAARAAGFRRVVSPDYQQYNAIAPPGRDGLIGFVEEFYKAIPNLNAVIHDVFATEDRVVVRWTISGNVTGAPFLGAAPQGQRLEFDVIDIWTIRNGQLYEHWDQFDWPRCFIQMGIQGLPAPFIEAAGRPVRR